MKQFTTIPDQINLLKEKHILISNDDYASTLLSSINYYRLMGYALRFKRTTDGKDDYQGISIEQIEEVHNKDKELRLLLLRDIETLELKIRCIIAYNLGSISNNIHNMPEYWYKNKFDIWHGSIAKSGFSNLKDLPILHHHRRIEEMPIWVTVEYLTLGQLINLYSGIHKDYIKSTQEHLLSIFQTDASNLYACLNHVRNFRNKCAHFSRLFDSTSEFRPGRRSPVAQIGIRKFMLSLANFEHRQEMHEILMSIDSLTKI